MVESLLLLSHELHRSLGDGAQKQSSDRGNCYSNLGHTFLPWKACMYQNPKRQDACELTFCPVADVAGLLQSCCLACDVQSLQRAAQNLAPLADAKLQDLLAETAFKRLRTS